MSDSTDNNNNNNNGSSGSGIPNIPQIPGNRSHLDALADKFSDTQDNNDFAAFMTELENSMVLVPAEAPAEITDEIREAAKAGKPLPIDKDHQPKVCLLQKTDGSKVFPVFTSPNQIPQDKRPPAIMNLPFKNVIIMLKNNPGEVSQIAVNPFTKGFVLNENLIDLVDKRYKAGANNPQAQGTNVRLTEQQFHSIAHVKMSREYLPKALYEDPQQVLSDLKLGKEKYVLDAYKHVYPANIRPPYTEDDMAVMSLQIEDDLIITRIDLPEKYTQEGSPLRIYITEHAGQYGYYMIERGANGLPGQIAQVDAAGTHTKIEEAPDNGAEIETIMGLIRPS